MFAKHSHLYAGNRNEGKTLPEMIQSLIGIRPDLAQHRTVIVDAGIAAEENVQYLKDNKFHYIVVIPSRLHLLIFVISSSRSLTYFYVRLRQFVVAASMRF